MFNDTHDKSSLTSKVYDHIHEGIINGQYHTGDFLIETKLAAELGVSRTPIREALKQLELEELVISSPNRGVIVNSLSSQDMDDIYTIRHLLEGQAAYWAAERIDQDSLNRLAELIELMDMYTRRNDGERLAKLDSEFHDVIYRASNSRMLRHILLSLHQNVGMARRSSLTVPIISSKSYGEHVAIYEAILCHDKEKAKASMEAHTKNANNRRTKS